MRFINADDIARELDISAYEAAEIADTLRHELARHACVLSRLWRVRAGSTSLDVFVELRDRLRSESDAAAAQLSEITEDEALRFLKEPNTQREVRTLAFAYFQPDEYPTHRMLQELVQLDGSCRRF